VLVGKVRLGMDPGKRCVLSPLDEHGINPCQPRKATKSQVDIQYPGVALLKRRKMFQYESSCYEDVLAK
jgi:hypothetical protein